MKDKLRPRNIKKHCSRLLEVSESHSRVLNCFDIFFHLCSLKYKDMTEKRYSSSAVPSPGHLYFMKVTRKRLTIVRHITEFVQHCWRWNQYYVYPKTFGHLSPQAAEHLTKSMDQHLLKKNSFSEWKKKNHPTCPHGFILWAPIQ